MIHIGLFEGIGGFSLAARLSGWETYLTCEIAEFPQRVLKYHFPEAYHHSDIKTLNYETIHNELSARRGEQWRKDKIIITGGFPCQPFSLAGKRKGTADDRYLWPEMLRVIAEVKPDYVVGENVFGLVNWDGGLVFDQVFSDLEAQGYEVGAYILPACGVNAPHKRYRVWFVAHSDNKRRGAGFEKIQGKNEEISKWDNNTKSRNAGLQATSSDPNIWRLEESTEVGRNRLNAEREGEPGPSPHTNVKRFKAGGELYKSGDKVEFARIDTKITASDAEIKRCESFKGYKSKEFFTQEKQGLYGGSCNGYGKQNNWENFPTQSPVCGGDDGLPTGLDGITFSKWRNESIKAYGNAIVPQVAQEIFRCINIYEQQVQWEIRPPGE